MAKINIAIVGAGIVGCATALHLCETLGPGVANISIFADKFSPNTTSDAAGSIIMPFDVTSSGKTEEENERKKIEKWAKESFKFFADLHSSKDAGKIDVQLVSGYYSDESADESTTFPWWAKLTTGFREVGLEEREKLNIPKCFKKVFGFSTYISNGRSLLPWMMEKIKQYGGVFVHRKISDLSELNDHDIVINCTGLGAYELVNDKSMYPVHGDAMLVKAPWVKQFYVFIYKDHKYTYIFPRCNDVLLGGSGRQDDWSVSADEASLEGIKTRCTSLIPSLAGAELLQVWGGLRPVRDSVRLEIDHAHTRDPLWIHCYGHGGQGVVLAWGCALDVGKIVSDFIHERKSKL